MHGISDAMVVAATFDQVLPELPRVTDGCMVRAYNEEPLTAPSSARLPTWAGAGTP
ncbi:hypothetical protein ACN6LA_003786 [Streptomyces sp. SAS_269]|uniref:hypothetical protein n=1 Tax=Streptomyces sp. SAS_269 TaxID=3412749 RepID=UPI00403C2E2C